MTKGILQYSPVYLKWQIDIKAPTSNELVTGIAGNIINSKAIADASNYSSNILRYHQITVTKLCIPFSKNKQANKL